MAKNNTTQPNAKNKQNSLSKAPTGLKNFENQFRYDSGEGMATAYSYNIQWYKTTDGLYIVYSVSEAIQYAKIREQRRGEGDRHKWTLTGKGRRIFADASRPASSLYIIISDGCGCRGR